MSSWSLVGDELVAIFLALRRERIRQAARIAMIAAAAQPTAMPITAPLLTEVDEEEVAAAVVEAVLEEEVEVIAL